MNIKIDEINKLLNTSSNILIAQADNPDGDSVSSALALEQILYDMNKKTTMYCGVNIPRHLQYLNGWDRIINEVPNDFDLTIIVDCSSKNLFESAEKKQQLSWLLAKPIIILDHHDVEPTIEATVIYNDPSCVSTGELIYDLATNLTWKLNIDSLNMLTVSILSDSLGLMTPSTTSKSINTIAELVKNGVNIPKLEEIRRALMKKSPEIIRYKGELLKDRIEYSYDQSIATITIPWEEIEKYSSQYNPSILVLDEMRMTEGTKIAIAFKTYPNNKITAKIRANFGYSIAKDLAEFFGAGGHKYSSGFKVIDNDFTSVKNRCVEKAHQLLLEISDESKEKTIL